MEWESILRHNKSAIAISDISTTKPPEETIELRRGLAEFLRQPLSNFVLEVPVTKKGKSITLGAVRWGVYAFFDYDGQPIYVGQTRESLGSRIGRHLTNQRTDAVAMSVLDPFEVCFVRVWPLPQYQLVKGDPKRNVEARQAADHLNALERAVFQELIRNSAFGSVLNEKDPPNVEPCELPPHVEGRIVSDAVRIIRQHPDVRIARRAQTIARLAQIIAGRDVAVGLRRALATQAERLSAIASERFMKLGGEGAVEVRARDEPSESDAERQEND